MDFDQDVKQAIYRHFAESGARPSADGIAAVLDASTNSVRESFQRLRAQRVLLLEDDEASIRMAPPFSGVPTQHVVTSRGVSYFANCAWDAFGIPIALHKPGLVRSRCEHTFEPLELEVTETGPPRSDWLFHCLVPAAHWWDDLIFT
jgi:Alkylmercury lyase